MPVLIGESAARYAILLMMVLPYVITAYLIASEVLHARRRHCVAGSARLPEDRPRLLKPKPETRPEGFPDGQGGWPLYFAPLAFVNNRAFGIRFLLAVILDAALRLMPFTSAFWR